MSIIKNKKGFTLIEIVIVLAIAALVLAAVLLAVSGAQKSRRDTQRKNDLGRIVANIETYASNHAGTYPAPAAGAPPATTYSGMNDPLSGAAYSPVAAAASGNAGDFTYTLGGTACDGSTSLTARQIKVEMKLESTDTACQDTH